MYGCYMTSFSPPPPSPLQPQSHWLSGCMELIQPYNEWLPRVQMTNQCPRGCLRDGCLLSELFSSPALVYTHTHTFANAQTHTHKHMQTHTDLPVEDSHYFSKPWSDTLSIQVGITNLQRSLWEERGTDIEMKSKRREHQRNIVGLLTWSEQQG